MSFAYLNGEYLPLDRARVSVLDRGFLFGDGVYEVIPVFHGEPYFLDRHLRRLQNSLDAVAIRYRADPVQWRDVIGRLLGMQSSPVQSVYLQVTRGVSLRGHLSETISPPTALAFCLSPGSDDRRNGVAAVIRDDVRWARCDVKAITLLANVMLRREAENAGAYEAILVSGGKVTEGAASNVFAVWNGRVRTPPKGRKILPGVTRDVLVECLRGAGIPCSETEIDADELPKADEIWLTSSSAEVVPVIRLDGAPIGDGRPGELWRRADSLYQSCKDRYRPA